MNKRAGDKKGKKKERKIKREQHTTVNRGRRDNNKQTREKARDAEWNGVSIGDGRNERNVRDYIPFFLGLLSCFFGSEMAGIEVWSLVAADSFGNNLVSPIGSEPPPRLMAAC